MPRWRCSQSGASSPDVAACLERLQALAVAFLAARLAYAYGYYKRPVSLPMQIGAGLTYVLELVLLNLLGVALFL